MRRIALPPDYVPDTRKNMAYFFAAASTDIFKGFQSLSDWLSSSVENAFKADVTCQRIHSFVCKEKLLVMHLSSVRLIQRHWKSENRISLSFSSQGTFIKLLRKCIFLVHEIQWPRKFIKCFDFCQIFSHKSRCKNNAISRNTIATAFSKTLQKTRSFRHYVNCNRDVQNTEYARPQKSQEF